jgi:hypothetical protein
MSKQPIQDLNDGKPWSEMGLFDLRNSLAYGDSIEEVAGFLCRAGTVEEVGRKALELGLLGPQPTVRSRPKAHSRLKTRSRPKRKRASK